MVYIGKGFRAIEIRTVVWTTLLFSLHLKPRSWGIFVGVATLERWSREIFVPKNHIGSEYHASRGMHIVPDVCFNDCGVRDMSFGDASSFVGGWFGRICMFAVTNYSSDN